MAANSIQWSLKSRSPRLFFILMYPGVLRDCLLYFLAVVVIYVFRDKCFPACSAGTLRIPPWRNFLGGRTLSLQCPSRQTIWGPHSVAH